MVIYPTSRVIMKTGKDSVCETLRRVLRNDQCPFHVSCVCVCVCVCACACAHTQLFSHVQLIVAPRTVAHQAPLSMGFSRQEYCSGVSFPTPGDLPHPLIKFVSLLSPALAGGFFTTSATWEAHLYSLVITSLL